VRRGRLSPSVTENQRAGNRGFHMQEMKYISHMVQKKPASFILLSIVITGLIVYTFSLFIYLKIVGVYAVATIKEGTSTSEGIDYRYEFYYAGKVFDGVFTDVRPHQLGDRYFVCFSKEKPSKNLLQFNQPVPHCLHDSLFTVWAEIPACLPRKTAR
jgi:hypothetical protein